MSKLDQLLGRITALSPEDRQWLLQNTPTQTRTQLLAALGSSTSVQRGPLSDSEIVANASPETVAQVLRTEPSWMAAAVYHLYPVDDGTVAARGVRDALIKRLAARLSETTVDPPQVPPARPLWQRLLRW